MVLSNVDFTCVNTGTAVLGPDNVTFFYLYNAIEARRWSMQRQVNKPVDENPPAVQTRFFPVSQYCLEGAPGGLQRSRAVLTFLHAQKCTRCAFNTARFDASAFAADARQD